MAGTPFESIQEPGQSPLVSLETSARPPIDEAQRTALLTAARQASGFLGGNDGLANSLNLNSRGLYPIQEAACIGRFDSAPPPEAYALNPPQIAQNGGMVVFRQNCDHELIKALKGFKPYV